MMRNLIVFLLFISIAPIISAQSIPMVEIPSGSFYMGSLGLEENYDEAPMHRVHISRPFMMSRTEITNA